MLQSICSAVLGIANAFKMCRQHVVVYAPLNSLASAQRWGTKHEKKLRCLLRSEAIRACRKRAKLGQALGRKTGLLGAQTTHNSGKLRHNRLQCHGTINGKAPQTEHVKSTAHASQCGLLLDQAALCFMQPACFDGLPGLHASTELLQLAVCLRHACAPARVRIFDHAVKVVDFLHFVPCHVTNEI